MQPLDDIAALTKRAQSLLGIRGQNPTRGTGGLGEPQPLKRPHPTDPDLPQGIALGIAFGTEINHSLRPSRFPGQRPIAVVSSVLLSPPLQALVEPPARIADPVRA